MKKTKNEIIKELGQPQISELMNEKKYWLIIATVFNSYINDDQKLNEQLSKLSCKEIIQFHLRTLDLANKIHTSGIGSAAIIMNWKYKEICNWNFHSAFRFWLITLGERIYYKILEEPDYLVNFLYEKYDRYYFFDNLDSVTAEMFEEMTNHDINEFIDLSLVSEKAELEISEEYKSEVEIQKVCPNLFETFKSFNEKRERIEKKNQKRLQNIRANNGIINKTSKV
jgi:hypothetical protein